MPESTVDSEKGTATTASGAIGNVKDDDKKEEDADKLPGKQSGMSQSSKDDLGVCIVIILITVLAIIVTVIKIVMFDIAAYPEIFGGGGEEGEAEPETTTEKLH